MNKEIEINYGIEQIQNILHMIRPNKKWEILYAKMTDDLLENFSDWHKQYHGIRKNEEYFLIYDEDGFLLYALNVTTQSTLYALSNLMMLLTDKF